MSNLDLSTMMWVLFLPIFESHLFLKKEPKPPGALKLQITQRGLAYAKTVGMELLLSQLRKQPMPDQCSTYNVPHLDEISWSFSNIQIKQLQVKDSEASFAKDKGVRLAIRNAQIVFTSNWTIKHLFGQDKGTLQTDIAVRSLSVLLGLDVDDGGWPVVRTLSCSADLLDFELMFNGLNSGFYNWISQGIKRTLISDFNQEVCIEVKKSVDHFSHNLRNAEFWTQIDPIAGFNYSLVSKPEIAEDRCNLDFKGEFFLMERHQKSPLVPTPIVLPKRSSSMVVIGISDFLVNSAAFVYFSGNMLRVKYTNKTIPKRVPFSAFRLNTQHIGSLFPELKRQFPKMPMELHLAAQKEPKLHFHPGGLDAIVLGRAEVFVVLPNSSLVPVFTLNVDCNFTGQIFLEGVRSGNSFAKVRGSVALKGLRLSQAWSSIGEIKLSPLETLLKIAGNVALSAHNRESRDPSPPFPGGITPPAMAGCGGARASWRPFS
uniref:Bactericidal permeability-increasing protein n=1 Tax=Laticauda laticaudata TaxID=8630 RepID=A0A8C5RDJ0_LATLA